MRAKAEAAAATQTIESDDKPTTQKGMVKTSTTTRSVDDGTEVTIRVLIPPEAQHVVIGDSGDNTNAVVSGMMRSIR